MKRGREDSTKGDPIHHREPAYLTILRTPKGLSAERLIEALATTVGADPYNTRLRLAKGLPAIVARLDAGVAGAVLGALAQLRIGAIAPTRARLREVGTPIAAKRLAPAVGAPEPMYLCEPWRAEPRGFLARDIGLIVRARIVRATRSSGNSALDAWDSPVQPRVASHAPATPSGRTTTSTLHDVMDLYLRDGTLLRCAGDKFNFDILGKQRGFTDNENMDRLALRLAEDAPEAQLDTGFAGFSPPPGILDTWGTVGAGGTSEKRDAHGVFDFYSPWTRLVHLALLGVER